jgi:hypothetical protein
MLRGLDLGGIGSCDPERQESKLVVSLNLALDDIVRLKTTGSSRVHLLVGFPTKIVSFGLRS